MMLWTAPTLRHQSAKGWLSEANHVEGSRPWARLARLGLILRSQCNLRGSDTAVDAVCSDQDPGTTDRLNAASDATIAGPAAHDAVERDPRAYGRIWHHLDQRPQWHG